MAENSSFAEVSVRFFKIISSPTTIIDKKSWHDTAELCSTPILQGNHNLPNRSPLPRFNVVAIMIIKPRCAAQHLQHVVYVAYNIERGRRGAQLLNV